MLDSDPNKSELLLNKFTNEVTIDICTCGPFMVRNIIDKVKHDILIFLDLDTLSYLRDF